MQQQLKQPLPFDPPLLQPVIKQFQLKYLNRLVKVAGPAFGKTTLDRITDISLCAFSDGFAMTFKLTLTFKEHLDTFQLSYIANTNIFLNCKKQIIMDIFNSFEDFLDKNIRVLDNTKLGRLIYG